MKFSICTTLLALFLVSTGCGDDDSSGSDAGTGDGGMQDAAPDSAGDLCAAVACGDFGTCVDGSCRCDEGWTGTGCESDVDECTDDPTACHADATCTNTDGGFTCACNDGFVGDGATCSASCAADPCMNGGVCTDGESGATCGCEGTGYEGDFCETDVDECADGDDDCADDATCTNTEGSFECACDDPFVGDGRTCMCPEGSSGDMCEVCGEGLLARTSDGVCSAIVTLHIEITGDGTGTVVVDGSPMVCTDSCEIEVADGDALEVHAAPTDTTRITGWSDAGAACSGADCMIAIAGDTTVGLAWELRHNIAFVTSTRINPGAIGSIANADSTCATLATAAGLHATEWVAMLATEAASCPGEASAGCNPLDRLDGARGWVNTQGQPIVDTIDQLRRGELWYPIRYEEDGGGGTGDHEVVTGLNPLLEPSAGFTCDDYTTMPDGQRVAFARAGSVSRNALSQSANARCNFPQAFLCFSIDHDTPLAAPADTGRLAFMTEAVWTPGGGLADADALCQLEACEAGLTGGGADCGADPGTDRTFLAFLESDDALAATRFDAAGADWVRSDGARWLATGSLATAESRRIVPETGLVLLADGTFATGSPHVWTGVTTGDTTATCTSWTASAGDAAFGSAENVFFEMRTGTRPCDRTARLYCLEE